MNQLARLITPDGESIDLPVEVYRQIMRLLETRPQRRSARSRAQINAAIRRGYGLLASPESFTQALLEERAAEKAREADKLSWFKG